MNHGIYRTHLKRKILIADTINDLGNQFRNRVLNLRLTCEVCPMPVVKKVTERGSYKSIGKMSYNGRVWASDGIEITD